ncbi:putative transposase [Bradyrhizobium sp. ERR14]|nr:putative transposase [Bradyrhizobium sp. ERR14]
MRSDWKVSIRRACSALRIDRALYVYKSKRGDQAALKGRIKDICETRVRYGYRRVHVLLQRDGWAINVKRVYRLYRELSLQLRNKAPKRRVKAKLREDRTEARQINETWAMDFVHDQLATGRKIRVLTIVDTFSRFSPAVDPRFSYRGEDVVLTLERICKILGYPRTIRVDQGSEFISRDLDIWAYQKGVVLDFSRPGKPTDNSFIESFNGKLRSECLNTHWFLSLDDARQKMEDWRRDYNEVRLHSAIGNKAPISLLNASSAPPPACITPENSSAGWPSFGEHFNQRPERTQDWIKLGGKVNDHEVEMVGNSSDTQSFRGPIVIGNRLTCRHGRIARIGMRERGLRLPRGGGEISSFPTFPMKR